jgi:hypothetical protein
MVADCASECYSISEEDLRRIIRDAGFIAYAAGHAVPAVLPEFDSSAFCSKRKRPLFKAVPALRQSQLIIPLWCFVIKSFNQETQAPSPLVLAHRTPNDTIPILHAVHGEWHGLFPRHD